MRLFKDRLFTVYFLSIMFVVLFAFTQTAFADPDPQPREPEYILQINLAEEIAPVVTFEIDDIVLEDILKLMSHLPMFKWFFAWFTIIMAIVGILNYIAYLTPWPWDDAIMQPVSAGFKKIAKILGKR